MEEHSDPNQLIGWLGIAGLGLVAFWLLLDWIKKAPAKPEPWGAEIEESLHTSEATPICHRCLTPHQTDSRFCGKCGTAVGHYNNLLPYINLFSEGEVLRNGVTDNIRVGPLTIIGLLLFSSVNYFIFAPIYWYFLFKNLERIEAEQLNQSPEDIE